MENFLDTRAHKRMQLKKYYHEKPNLRLKHAAFASISAAIILMLVMIVWIDSISITLLLLMRVFAGLLTSAFVVLVAVLVYRVNAAYLRDMGAKNRRGH